MDLGTVITTVTVALFSSGTTAAIVAGVTRRKVTRAEAADALTDSAIELLNAVKHDARADLTAMRAEVAEARRETAEARREAAEARAAVREARVGAEALAAYLNRVVAAINEPSMTMERLRLLVGSGPPPNGHAGLSRPG